MLVDIEVIEVVSYSVTITCIWYARECRIFVISSISIGEFGLWQNEKQGSTELKVLRGRLFLPAPLYLFISLQNSAYEFLHIQGQAKRKRSMDGTKKCICICIRLCVTGGVRREYTSFILSATDFSYFFTAPHVFLVPVCIRSLHGNTFMIRFSPLFPRPDKDPRAPERIRTFM